MSISLAVRKQKIAREIRVLDDEISHSISNIGLDQEIFYDSESILNNIDSFMHASPSHPTHRFCCGFRLWKSVPKEGNEDHWMYSLCSAEETHFPAPIDESYGRKDFVEVGNNFTNQEGILGLVKRHDVIYHDPGVALIIYSEAGSDVETVDGTISIDVEQFIRSAHMVHPYSASASIHEMFKLLLEWQWAFLYAESDEPMALIANDFLNNLNLHVDRDGTDPVVTSLMKLPDQQVAQYFKTGTCSLNDTAPECPIDFKVWLIEKNIVQLLDRNIKDLFDISIKRIRAQRRYDAIN